MIRFVNREEEIKVLEEAAKSSNAEFIVIYGRRRVGKTRLIVEFLKGKDGIFYIAEDASKRVQIREIKEKIAEYFNDKFLRNVEIGEWEELFEYLKKILPRDRRIYFVIDEFSYLVKNSPEIVSVLQKFWDTLKMEGLCVQNLLLSLIRRSSRLKKRSFGCFIVEMRRGCQFI